MLHCRHNLTKAKIFKHIIQITTILKHIISTTDTGRYYLKFELTGNDVLINVLSFRIFARKIGDAFSRYLNDLNFEVTERILQHKAFGKQVLFSW